MMLEMKKIPLESEVEKSRQVQERGLEWQVRIEWFHLTNKWKIGVRINPIEWRVDYSEAIKNLNPICNRF